MGKSPNRTTVDACRPLADAVLKVRKVGIVTEQWIARALEDDLAAHQWRELGNRPYKAGLGRRVAKLVYSGKEQAELSRSLASLIPQNRVLERVRGFFVRSGLSETGIPLDHRGVGRNELMGAMISRFVYDGAPGYQAELSRQGSYTLLQGTGQNQVNRSLLCVDALNSNSVMWAFNLYRNVGDPTDVLRWRIGVFLPEAPPTALLSASRWIDPEALVRKCFDDEAANVVLTAIRNPISGEDVSESGLTLLTLKSGNEGQLIERGRLAALGYLKLEERLGMGALEQLGLTQRDSLASAEAAVTPRLSGDQIQTLADAEEALARYAATVSDEPV